VSVHNVIVIGSGPAGLAAAIYLSRAELAPVVIEGLGAGGTPPGGQLMTTGDVENYPGFPEGISGPELMMRMREQAERFGTAFVMGDVTSADLSSKPFKLEVNEDENLEAHALIIATGATARYLGLENEQKLIGRGVSGCATCDGAFFKEQDVVVVGGGDTAMEDALFLSRICRSVTVIHRRDELRASRYMAEKVKSNAKISFAWNSEVIDVSDVEKGTVTSVRLRNLKTGVESDLPCEGLFLAIGHTPNSACFGDDVDVLPSGYIKTEGNSTRTNLKGVFAAGDIMDPTYRQAITAAGSGCKAALDVERFLAILGGGEG